MRVLFTLAIMASLLLAGCANTTPVPTDDHVEDDMGDEHGDVNETLVPSAPTLELGLDFINGTAPLTVNFTIQATNATAWTLDFGDGNTTNGTSFPANASYVFAAGTYNITVAVVGEGGNATQNATVVVDAFVEPAVVLEPFTQTVTMDLPCPGCGDGGTSTCTWRVHGSGSAQDCAWIDFPDDLVGQPFSLVGAGLDADLLFWDSCNSGVNAKFHGSGNEAGVIPAGAGCVLVWEQIDFLVDLTFSIVPA